MMRNKNVTFSKFDLNSFVDDFANLKINLYWHLDKIESDVMMECGREERMECGRERDVMMECDKGMLDCGDGCDGRDERYTDYRCEGRMDYVCDGEEKMDYRCTTEEGRMDCNIDCNNKGRLNYFYKSKRYNTY
ncbi:hypothetical protein NAPIS_ORF00573 [Vairimorpha apis BRL 01]|uniref:Uncharacterized protein n=1 Tax=Vairimorpha apis BRL 01 TaxID=1037528 RepID=T0LBY8_9MICR|nr:hypothetical protein NAPIS_ORF00573 [Vairimorpha apis BRL 01]